MRIASETRKIMAAAVRMLATPPNPKGTYNHDPLYMYNLWHPIH
ncbi:hypothetical protein SAMN05444398_1301 [Roseovarius pacificus]|uniref:Uncharacterized protein n=1 Tax=Roseovarius pacificus TaxID=337701 RepID=A0A1M7KJU4_9RHOB|nr:hypothetical protein SAMN05444398_1301 [Roseovarius pacificus]